VGSSYEHLGAEPIRPVRVPLFAIARPARKGTLVVPEKCEDSERQKGCRIRCRCRWLAGDLQRGTGERATSRTLRPTGRSARYCVPLQLSRNSVAYKPSRERVNYVEWHATILRGVHHRAATATSPSVQLNTVFTSASSLTSSRPVGQRTSSWSTCVACPNPKWTRWSL